MCYAMIFPVLFKILDLIGLKMVALLSFENEIKRNSYLAKEIHPRESIFSTDYKTNMISVT